MPDGHPFVRHEFLAALESSGSIRERLGWRPHHLAVYDGDRLVGAAPCYLKANSHGEFVFDHAWADAYERFGLDYYPKLLCAVPYSPVTGPRLLGAATFAHFAHETERLRLSSAHVNFMEGDVALDARWLERNDIQFHWTNRGYATFDDFLGALTSKRRKEIRRERAPFRDWSFEWHAGDTLDEALIDFVHGCYVGTFAEKGNHSALTRAFFATLASDLPHAIRVLVAREAEEPVAMAFCLAGGDTLYGRYWGTTQAVPMLHFECCYYRGIERAIAEGFARFEPGAQGEHKLARGFLPVRTRSAHHVAEPRFRDAIAASLVRERAWVERYETTLAAHSPYATRDESAPSRDEPTPSSRDRSS